MNILLKTLDTIIENVSQPILKQKYQKLINFQICTEYCPLKKLRYQRTQINRFSKNDAFQNKYQNNFYNIMMAGTYFGSFIKSERIAAV